MDCVSSSLLLLSRLLLLEDLSLWVMLCLFLKLSAREACKWKTTVGRARSTRSYQVRHKADARYLHEQRSARLYITFICRGEYVAIFLCLRRLAEKSVDGETSEIREIILADTIPLSSAQRYSKATSESCTPADDNYADICTNLQVPTDQYLSAGT